MQLLEIQKQGPQHEATAREMGWSAISRALMVCGTAQAQVTHGGAAGYSLCPRPWWKVPGAGPVTIASLETPAFGEESELKEMTWRGKE